MSNYTGVDIVNSGLVLYYDANNTKKSWKGKPTVNFIGNGHFAGGLGIENESGSYGTYSIVQLENPGDSSYVLRQSGGALGGEYEVHVRSGLPTSLNPNTTYCMSCWVAVTPDYDGDSQTHHSRWYDGSGIGNTTGGTGAVVETQVVGGLTWERRYQTFTTPSTTSGQYQWYIGYPTGGTKGYRYVTNVQLEESSYPTPYVSGSRSATQAVVDMTGNNSITASSLTYNSDGSFSFNGSSNYISIPNPVPSNAPYTILQWVKPDAPLTDTFATDGTGRKTPLVGPGPQWSPGYWLTARNFRVHAFTEYRDHTINLVGNTGWHQLGQWFDGTNCYGILDGVLLSGGTRTAYAPGSQSTILIGSETTSGSSFSWNGKLGALQIYNRALSAAEIAQNFNAVRNRYNV